MHKNKITLVSTVSVAPCFRQLVTEGWFKASTEFETLFGGFLTPEVAAKMLWDSVDVTPTTAATAKGKENAAVGGGGGERRPSTVSDIWSSSNETMMTSWRAEDNPPSSSMSKTSRLIWDADSDVSQSFSTLALLVRPLHCESSSSKLSLTCRKISRRGIAKVNCD